jgi:hypothetical protein
MKPGTVRGLLSPYKPSANIGVLVAAAALQPAGKSDSPASLDSGHNSHKQNLNSSSCAVYNNSHKQTACEFALWKYSEAVFRCKVQNSKVSYQMVTALVRRIKYRRNKKLIAQFSCKLRDESIEPN